MYTIICNPNTRTFNQRFTLKIIIPARYFAVNETKQTNDIRYSSLYLKLCRHQSLAVTGTLTPKDTTQLGVTGSNWFWNVQNPATGRSTDQISCLES